MFISIFSVNLHLTESLGVEFRMGISFKNFEDIAPLHLPPVMPIERLMPF